MPELKEFTLGQYIDAIEKNGLKQGFNTLWKDADGYDIYAYEIGEGVVKIGSACALGQGNINMGIRDFEDYGEHDFLREFTDFVVDLNDSRHFKLATIAKRARIKFAEYLDVKLHGIPLDFTNKVQYKRGHKP